MTKRVWRPGEDQIMSAAWVGLMDNLIGKPEVRQEFEVATGALPFLPGKNALEKAIDEATGRASHYVRAFCEWATDAYWGEPMPPTIAKAWADANVQNLHIAPPPPPPPPPLRDVYDGGRRKK